MTLTTLPLKRLSICPCGFGVLKDEIQLGTLYRVDLDSRRTGALYRCGDCNFTQNDVEVVEVMQRKAGTLAPLPWLLFVPEQTS